MLRHGLWIAISLCACVAPPSSQPPPQPLFGTHAGGPLGPPKVSQPPLAPDAFDDGDRASRVKAALPALDAHFAAARESLKLPGLAVAVVVDGEMVMAKGYGTRDDQGATVDGDTVFRIGSITKVITSMAILALRDEGKLALDDPAAKYLPELAGLMYPTTDAAPITVRQMLTHDSGLPRNGVFSGNSHVAPTLEQVKRGYDGLLLERAPGLGPHYSNLGVGSLSLVIESASGKPYRDYVNAMLAPLGLHSAAWDASDVPADKLALAHGGSGKPIPAERHWRLGPIEAAGGLYLSAADLAKVVAYHLDAWPPRSDRERGPLRRASLRESHEMKAFEGVRGRLKDEGANKEVRTSARGTGFAWQVEQTCKLEHLVWHNGGTEGYHAAAFMLPQRGVGIVALTNADISLDASAIQALQLLVDNAKLEPRRARPAPRLEEVMTAVDTLLDKGNINEPDYLALFGASFREAVPLAALRETTAQLRARHGSCKRERWTEVDSPTEGRARYRCDDGTEKDVYVILETGTPQVVGGMLLQDPQPPSEDRERCR